MRRSLVQLAAGATLSLAAPVPLIIDTDAGFDVRPTSPPPPPSLPHALPASGD